MKLNIELETFCEIINCMQSTWSENTLPIIDVLSALPFVDALRVADWFNTNNECHKTFKLYYNKPFEKWDLWEQI